MHLVLCRFQNLEDATMDNSIYKHLRRVIENEEPENSEAQRDLRGLLLTERKYSTLHPEEQVRSTSISEVLSYGYIKSGNQCNQKKK